MFELIPLLALFAAMASGERHGRAVTGDPHRRTILDQMADAERMGKFLAPWVKANGRNFEKFAIHLNRSVGAPDAALQDFSTIGIYTTIYGTALAEGHPPIWALDNDAFDALTKTEVPFELIRSELPRLPFPSVLITFPDGIYLEGEDAPTQPASAGQTPYVGGGLKITSIMIMEEIPGIRWRFMAYEENPRGPVSNFTRGWIDLRRGPLRDQMPLYSEKGHNAIWQLLFNLFLTLQHGYLAGRNVQPRLPKSPGKKKKFARRHSARPYTLIDLTAATRAAAAPKLEPTPPEDKRRGPVRHTVRGHWRTYWVNDPEDRLVIGNRDVQRGGNFKIAKYLPPFMRGSGEDGRRGYRVTAPGWKKD